MKKRLLFSLFDMEVGGVERSFISMANHLDYELHDVDLMLCRHQGDLLNLLPHELQLLNEIPEYTTFRKSIKEVFLEKQYLIGLSRVIAKGITFIRAKLKKMYEPGYFQMQMTWKYSLPFLPQINKEYDVAISYLWPHYFIADKVKAKKKIAWIHTDYSIVETNREMDLEMWNKFDHIIAVSEACKRSFLKKYSQLENKMIVIENITSPEFILNMVNENAENNLMLHDDRFKLVTVARLSHAKGIDSAIKALKILVDKGYDNMVWYVVGYGGEEAMLRELVARNDLKNNFILLGKKINPYPFIAAGDLYVQPSRYEGKAVTVTEAKIIGKPILITNYSTAESQVENGIDGIICDLSVEGLSSGIEQLYNNEKLSHSLINTLKSRDHSNSDELDKLYELIGTHTFVKQSVDADIKVSVIVPVYNAEKYISQCIESLINQLLQDCEFIFINDGSEDKSKQIIEQYQRHDDRIMLINQENQGVSSARNAGLLMASGEYVGFVDADDDVDKEMYETLYSAAIVNNLDCVISNIENEIDGIKVMTKYPFPVNKILDKSFIEQEIMVYFLESDQLNTAVNKIYKRNIMIENNVFFPKEVTLGEDAMFNVKFMNAAATIKYIDYTGYHYREVVGSATRDIGKKDYFNNALNVYKMNFPEAYIRGIDPHKIQYLKSIKLIKNVMAYIHIYFKPSLDRGLIERYRYINHMIGHLMVREALPAYLSQTSGTLGRYEKWMIILIKTKSTMGLYFMTAYSRFRNKKKMGR